MKFAFGRGYIHIFAFRRCPKEDRWTQTVIDIFATSLVFGIQKFATVVSGFYPSFLDTSVNGFGYGSGLTAGLLLELIVRNPTLLFPHSLFPIQNPAEGSSSNDKHDTKLGVGHFFHQTIEDRSEERRVGKESRSRW